MAPRPQIPRQGYREIHANNGDDYESPWTARLRLWPGIFLAETPPTVALKDLSPSLFRPSVRPNGSFRSLPEEGNSYYL